MNRTGAKWGFGIIEKCANVGETCVDAGSVSLYMQDCSKTGLGFGVRSRLQLETEGVQLAFSLGVGLVLWVE